MCFHQLRLIEKEEKIAHHSPFTWQLRKKTKQNSTSYHVKHENYHKKTGSLMLE